MSLPTHSQPLLLLALLLLLSPVVPTTVSSPLSTVAISHIPNQTLVCALALPSPAGDSSDLSCISLPGGARRSYRSGASSVSAIAAGEGFLCALGPASLQPNVSTMRWWDFERGAGEDGWTPAPKRVYLGPALTGLSAGDSHVCALRVDTREVDCWRWPELGLPEGLNVTGIAVGGEFLCGLLSEGGEIRCFGNDTAVVGGVPSGRYGMLAAGSRHACAVSRGGDLVCWGAGAPKVRRTPFQIISLALGLNRTCALSTNGIVQCWGVNFRLPDGFVRTQFVAIEAKGSAFCGILMANYSLLCWGSQIFDPNPIVYDRVLPGTCTDKSSCSSCGVLPGSGNICANGGVICDPCAPEIEPGPEASLPPAAPPLAPPSVGSGPTAPPPRRSNGPGMRRVVFLVVGSVGLAVGLATAAACFVYLCLKQKSGRVHDSGRLHAAVGPMLPGEPSARAGARGEELSEPAPADSRIRTLLSKGHSITIEEFPLQALLSATDNFSEDKKIGSGSFGSVYRAVLTDGREVAIKRAEPSAASTSRAPDRRRDTEAAFVAELALLSRINHKNLVHLHGFCRAGGERVLVYEYMPNGTLHDHLHKLPSSPLSSWGARLRVALDAARGVEYLHAYAVPPVIHRDIKSSNILLDGEWTAKVSDFGLSLLNPGSGRRDGDINVDRWSDDDSVPQAAAGTVGYMDPEYYRLQNLTTKSDVYSFGVVLLELLTGVKAVHRHGDSGTPRNVVEWSVPLIEADDVYRVLDGRLPPPTPSEIEAVASAGYLAADCVRPAGRDRPTMKEIVAALERTMSSPSPALPRSSTTRSI